MKRALPGRRARLPRWLFHVLVALTALFALRSAYAEQDQPAILSLILNHEEHGEVTVVLRGRDVLVAGDDLRRAGLVRLADGTETIFGKRAVSLRSLSPTVTYSFDERALTLRVNVAPHLLRKTVVDLRPAPPPEIEHSQDTSAWLNYAARLVDATHPEGHVEAGLSAFGSVLATTAIAASPENGVVRGLSSVTVDDRDTLRRWVIGDAFVTSGALGAGLFTAGLSVSKTYRLAPYVSPAPPLGASGVALTPSSLEVLVNSVTVKRESLSAGPFEVTNIQVPVGSGEIQCVVRDVFGRTQTVSSPYYASADALAEGLSDYSYTIGVKRDNVGHESFSYSSLALLGRHRYGLTRSITAGARMEVGDALVSGGPSLTLVGAMGQIDLELAASATPAGLGGAAQAAYAYSGGHLSGGLVTRIVSDGYATLSLSPGDRRERVHVSAYTSTAIGPRASLAARYQLAVDRDHGASMRVGLSANIQIAERISLVLGVARSAMPDGRAPFEGMAGLSGTLGDNIAVSASTHASPDGHETTAAISKPEPQEPGFGYRLMATAGAAPHAAAAAQYHWPYGRYEATVDITRDKPHLMLGATGAIVAMRGLGVAATLPVQDGFAVIRVPGVPGVVGYLNNQEVGRTDDGGNLVVPGLVAHYGNRIAIADRDLPLDRSITAVERTIAPPFRGGAMVQFDVQRAMFARGRLVVVDGSARTIPAYGEIAVRTQSGLKSSPIGQLGEFDLPDLGPGEYSATITYNKGACAFVLEVPEHSGPVVEVGERQCVRSH